MTHILRLLVVCAVGLSVACGDDDDAGSGGTSSSGTGGISGTGGVGGVAGGGTGGSSGSGGVGGGLPGGSYGSPCGGPTDPIPSACMQGLTCVPNFIPSPSDGSLVSGCTQTCFTNNDCAGVAGAMCRLIDGSPVCSRQPLSTVGEPCLADFECNTGNCSYYSHVCRVPVGAACDATNCDNCWSQGDWSFCSRPCADDGECNGEMCLGSAELGFECQPTCSSTCPGQCRFVASSSDQYCWCPDCEYAAPPRALGDICSYGAQCTSGDCYTGPTTCDSVILSLQTCGNESGFCTTTCTADSDCTNGTRCIDVACADGEVDTCGQKCLLGCSPGALLGGCQLGECQSLPLVGGGEASVCGQKAAVGRSCRFASDCLSNQCVSQICAPSGGAANGAQCDGNSGCASGSCVSGSCRGAGLIGDACTMPADCAVGTCCPNNTCGNGC